MARNDRQKRSARKARQAERAEHEAAVVENAVAQGKDPEKLKEQAAKAQARRAEEKNKKPGLFKRVSTWFGDVIREMKRVVWPTSKELRNYSFAVIGLLIAFGLVVWVIDTGVVAGLVQLSKLGPNATTAEVQIVDSTDEDAGTAAEDAEAEDSADEDTDASSDASAEDADATETTDDGSAGAEAEASAESEDAETEGGE